MVTEPVYPEVASDGALVVPVRPPAAREAVAVADYKGHVRGQRVLVLQATEWVFDVRAVSEPYQDGRGRTVVEVTSEEAYYRNPAPPSPGLSR
ncbi:hypothetical protein, partial [Aquipuribacter sp. MA13-6]|uniref:hypothetical protein n=1 Tax=unclassified Aquipuribacter TaxID=2635084 RepID=UPI003EECEB56